ncbi:MAG: endoribonuclease MazF [Proteobacteria bacterium]|nr:endoribonuclease MazF [Pseudomonadota bacterium]
MKGRLLICPFKTTTLLFVKVTRSNRYLTKLRPKISIKKFIQNLFVAKKLGKDKAYIPQRGDIVWIDLDPSQGSEIKKTRPALVISPMSYNEKVGLALLCPITSHKKGYPFEVDVQPNESIKGVILADQVKSLDWKVRKARFEGRVSPEVMIEVLEKLSVLIEIS